MKKHKTVKRAKAIFSVEETAAYIGISIEELVMESRRKNFLPIAIYPLSDGSFQYGFFLPSIQDWMAENGIAQHH